MFLAACQRTRLDPWLRQIYLQGRWDNRAQTMKWGIQASIDGLRIVAQRSGEYEGQTKVEWFDGTAWTDVWLSDKTPLVARVGVWRTRFREPLFAVAHWSEYAVTGSGDFMWRKMPALMLGKVAEALALRKAFPQDLSGIYTPDEMAQSGQAPVQAEEMDAGSRQVLLETLVDTIDTATTDEELVAVWRAAGEHGLLDTEVDDGTIRQQIIDRRASLHEGEVEDAIVVEDVPEGADA
jgi:phage recombination protein Bet